MIDLSPVWMTGLPLPPSSNRQYKPFKNSRTGKLSFKATPELTAFKSNLNQSFYQHPTHFIHTLKKLQLWIDHGVFFEVKATFFFEKSKVLTQKNQPKIMDISNRLKSLHDGLSTLLNIDDSLFFKISGEKRLTTQTNPVEGVSVEFIPYFIDL